MIVIISKYVLGKRFNGITLWPFVVLRKREMKNDSRLLNHERIHFAQQAEMLVLPFYLWYGIEFLIRWFQYKNRQDAYRNISFEREAYTHEADLNYRKKRRFFGFLQFMFKK